MYALPYSSECNEYTATTLYKLVFGELVDSVCFLGQNWSKICYLPQNWSWATLFQHCTIQHALKRELLTLILLALINNFTLDGMTKFLTCASTGEKWVGRGATELLQSFLLSTSKHLSLHDSQHTGRPGKRCIFKLDGFQSQLCHLLRLLLCISAVLWSAAEPALDGTEPVARPPAHDLYRSVHINWCEDTRN